MSNALQETLAILREMKESYPNGVIVSYSGGKDSSVVMELCARTWRRGRVSAFFLYPVPDLDCIRPAMDYARDRWGVEVMQLPHPEMADALRRGVYSGGSHKLDDLPSFNHTDVYDMARGRTKLRAVVTGMKRCDSIVRRGLLGKWRAMGDDDLWHPIAGWTNHDVRAYVQRHNLVAPLSASSTSFGVGLEEPGLCWLYEKYPSDWQKLAALFPFAEAAIVRRRLYGDEKERAKARRIERAAKPR